MALSAPQQRVYDLAKQLGWDDEAAAVAVAVASAEGIGGSVGDNGCSYGTFQLNFCGGLGNTWAQAQGFSDAIGRASLASNWTAADRWFMEKVLGPQINWARAQGNKGADLARAAGKAAERPAEGNEQNYATSFVAIFGPGGVASNAVTSAATSIGGAATAAGVNPSSAVQKVASAPAAISSAAQSAIAKLTGTDSLVGVAVTALKSWAAYFAWLGQVNIWRRAGLTVLGAVLVVVGLVVTALSFKEVQQAAGTVAAAA